MLTDEDYVALIKYIPIEAHDVRKVAKAVIDKMLPWCAAREAKLGNELYARYREQIGETWYWQGDGEDHLESTTCPVLIEAQDLRDLVKQARQEVARELISRFKVLFWVDDDAKTAGDIVTGSVIYSEIKDMEAHYEEG